jgi:hypothetical protein
MLAIIAGCERGPTAAIDPAPAVKSHEHEHELHELALFEQIRRTQADFAALPPSQQVLGPDPYRLAALGDGRLVGVLRGDDALVVIDEHGVEQARLAAPRSPSGLAVSSEGDVLVVGDGARELAHYRSVAGQLVQVATVAVDALGLRSVALDGKTAYVVEERTGRLLAIGLARGPDRGFRSTGVRELGRCHGPLHLEAVAGVVAVNCVLDHAIELWRNGEVVRIHHDGPIWSLALHREPDGGLLIAAGGVEDHPLEREDGGFNYIDSFLYLYRLAPGAAQPIRLAAVNSSALDVVTPKWIAIDAGDGAVSLTSAGYATPTLVTLTWHGGDFTAEPAVARHTVMPGTTAAVIGRDGTMIAADPLLDAWLVGDRLVAVPSPRPPRAALSRIGELLFFTTMMSPWGTAEGKRSRFTCETCHHEGYIDGRVHYTGRGDVHATTRPLYGLFNLRPYFSRALDKTMADMVHAEFRVANRHNDRDPWFALGPADLPWLARVGDMPPQLAPAQLRQALMAFLMDFTHRSNPAADHARFTERERAGAEAFRDRCASCHAAQLVADNPASLVPFERWESLVLSPSGPLVWSNAAYARTGVLPYVHDNGARVAPLRRLYKKWPYFTNGSARSLADVLDQFATGPIASYHSGAPADPALTRLSPDEKSALLAFLDLL